MSSISRRSFLGGAVFAGLSAGAMGLAGCASGSEAKIQTADTGNVATEGTPSFLIKPEPYTEWADELGADVVVIGQGLAGVCAARKALEDGAKVIAVEQAETPLYRSAQFGVINSEFQKSVGHEFSDEEVTHIIDALMVNFGQRADRKIWQRWAAESGAIFDWMISAMPDYLVIDPRENNDNVGLKFDLETETVTDLEGNTTDADGKPYYAITINNWPGNPEIDNSTEKYPVWEGPCELLPKQDPWMDAVMETFAADGNMTQLFSTWGRQLITDDSGRVVGVFVEDIDGNITKINANKGVVIATGGYLSNQEMADTYAKEVALFPNNVWFQTDAKGELSTNGSGICMGAWAGGAIDDIPHAFILHGFGGGLGQDPYLLFNNRGERFMNEAVLPNLVSTAVGHCPDGHCWQIFDDNYAEQVHAFQGGHAGYWKIVDSMDNQPWGNFCEGAGMKTRADVEAGSDFVCNTLEEVAEKTGVPAETLKATVERYNQLAEQGLDVDFGKDPRRLFPLTTPPFYVKEFTANGAGMAAETVFSSLNGLKSNCEAQVLNAEGSPVPGLFVCGNSQGSRFAFDYPVTYMGTSHGLAMTYGYIAGMNAAAGM
ncbi:FAD-binding protein [Adlercreutzia sp. R25]|uniref:FAD-dependent oxidoreductase n=1 Tax=Adlercreutzia shanghongiae TaxID=3111773 RepID=UPI002DB5B601|nr:FAD-binding protein [Adlercreutzia sp. R25]MEC4271910.1 FAD-binding protein [Adlercreutzia sp. R25]